MLSIRQVHGAGGQRGVNIEVNLRSLPFDLQARFEGPANGLQPRFEGLVVTEVTWWIETLAPVLDAEPGSKARADAVAALDGTRVTDWRGRPRLLSTTAIYRRVAAIEAEGLAAAARKRRVDAGKARVTLSRDLDKLTGFPADTLEQMRESMRLTMRGWLNSGATRSRAIAQLTDALMKMITGQGHRPHDLDEFRRACRVAVRSLYDRERAPAKKVYQRDHDRKRSDDDKPRVRRRAPNGPAECYVFDVHHINVLVRGENGKIGTVKMLGCFDWGTRRLRADFVFFDERGGVRNLDNIESIRLIFADPAWGVPKTIYVDNGKEYEFARFLDTLLKLNAAGAYFDDKVRSSRVIKAKPYNGAAKPIENVFHQMNNHEFRHLPGFIGDDRMNPMEVKTGNRPSRWCRSSAQSKT